MDADVLDTQSNKTIGLGIKPSSRNIRGTVAELKRGEMCIGAERSFYDKINSFE